MKFQQPICVYVFPLVVSLELGCTSKPVITQCGSAITSQLFGSYLCRLLLFPCIEPRILMESTMPLTLENIEYDKAESGGCIVEVVQLSSATSDGMLHLSLIHI